MTIKMGNVFPSMTINREKKKEKKETRSDMTNTAKRLHGIHAKNVSRHTHTQKLLLLLLNRKNPMSNEASVGNTQRFRKKKTKKRKGTKTHTV